MKKIYGLALRSLLGTAVGGALFAGAIAVPSVQAATVRGFCGSIQTSKIAEQVDLSSLDVSGTISFRGQTLAVEPAVTWLDLNPTDPLWTEYFNWMEWLGPLASIDASRATEIFLNRSTAVPDPGLAVTQAERARTGWGEAAVTKRLRVATCLHYLTGDARLVPPIESLVAAAMEPTRYYGLPFHHPHNHGLMSNMTMYFVGALLSRPDWQSFALARLQTDAAQVFDRCGLSFEQSIAYQRLNMKLWANVSHQLKMDVLPTGTYERGLAALAALARPDGVLEAIGDGETGVFVTPSGARLWCPKSGFAADTIDDAHYVVRAGPKRYAHGHEDHGSMMWFAAGVPVLSDRGRAAKTDTVALSWSRSLAAHSVLEPLGQTTSGRTRMEPTGASRFLFTDSPGGSTRTRGVKFHANSIYVVDRASVPLADPLTPWTWVQHWQLAPGWIPDATGATYLDGTRLDVVCRGGTLASVPVMSYIDVQAPEAAWDITCTASGTSVVLATTLTVTPAPVLPVSS
jgi:hypothetical protein